VAKRIGSEIRSIPQLQKENRYDISADVVGILLPVYFGNVPHFAGKYLKKVNIRANYVFTILTYGGATFGASQRLKSLLKKRNIRVDYANEILMVDNYLPLFDVREEVRKKNENTIDKKIDGIISDIQNKRHRQIRRHWFQRLISAFLTLKKPDHEDRKFTVNDDCNACNTCKNVCCKNNIIISDKPHYQHNCEFCLACIHACPKNAIHLKNEKSSARYLHRHITPAEIIRANKP
jgi:ferredoxin